MKQEIGPFFKAQCDLCTQKYFVGLYPAIPQGDQVNTLLTDFANHVCAD